MECRFCDSRCVESDSSFLLCGYRSSLCFLFSAMLVASAVKVPQCTLTARQKHWMFEKRVKSCISFDCCWEQPCNNALPRQTSRWNDGKITHLHSLSTLRVNMHFHIHYSIAVQGLITMSFIYMTFMGHQYCTHCFLF